MPQLIASNYTSLRRVLAQLNEPNARLGKNWLSRYLGRHPDLKTARNRGLDSKRIIAAIPSQIEGWFARVNDIVQRFNIHPQDRLEYG
jgi:hypothetical protein